MAGLGDSVHTIANPGYGTEDGCGKRFTHIALRAQAATPERVRQIITFFGNLRFVGIGEVVRDRDGFRFQLHRRPQDLFPQLGRRKLLRRKRTA
jgi:hypothetical protein